MGWRNRCSRSGAISARPSGPLLAAFIVVPKGQQSIQWFSAAALIGMVILWQVGNWYATHIPARGAGRPMRAADALPTRRVVAAIAVLVLLVTSKFIYLTSLSSYYTFYVIEKFHVSVQNAQLLLFLYLGAVAVGTVAGGAVVDRFGTKFVIWFSILGTLPFTLALPYVDLTWTAVAHGHHRADHRLGVLRHRGVRPGIAARPGRARRGPVLRPRFRDRGVGAAVLGEVADWKAIDFVYMVCSFLPAFGLVTVFLPNMPGARAPAGEGLDSDERPRDAVASTGRITMAQDLSAFNSPARCAAAIRSNCPRTTTTTRWPAAAIAAPIWAAGATSRRRPKS